MLENIIFSKIPLLPLLVSTTFKKKYVFNITSVLVRSLHVNPVKNFISVYINFNSIACLNE